MSNVGKIICLHPEIADVIKRPDMIALMEKGHAIPMPIPEGQTVPQTIEYKGATFELASDNQHYKRTYKG